MSKTLCGGDRAGSETNFLQYCEDAIEAYRWGMTFLDADELNQAAASFTEAIELNPKYVHAWFARGYANACRGDHRASPISAKRSAWMRTTPPPITTGPPLIGD